MPTPLYALRLPQETQDAIASLAKIYGAPTGRAFAREVLEVMTSQDTERIKAFNGRLIRGMGEQLTLTLNSSLDTLSGAEKPAKQARKRAGRGKPALKRRKA